MKTEHSFEISSDHFQILFGDEVAAPLVDTAELWETPGRIAHLAGAPELVGLGTARYGGSTRLTVSVSDMQDELPEGWNKLGSFSINVSSGRLIFWAPEWNELENAPGISLTPGCYRGIAFSRGEDEVTDEMASQGPDEYLILLCNER